MTVRSELVWLRALALGVLSSFLLGAVTLFDGIPDYIDEALQDAYIPTNISALVKNTADIANFDYLANQKLDETLQIVRSIAANTHDIESDLDTIRKRLYKSFQKLTAVEVETAAIDVSTSANAATTLLIWKQFANYLEQFALLRDEIVKLNAQVVDIAETVLDQSIAVDLIKEGQTTVITLLTSIESSVKYEEITFRKRVRHALIGTTIIATSEYEAGGQCDILPEECTLVGEAEMEVEDVII